MTSRRMKFEIFGQPRRAYLTVFEAIQPEVAVARTLVYGGMRSWVGVSRVAYCVLFVWRTAVMDGVERRSVRPCDRRVAIKVLI